MTTSLAQQLKKLQLPQSSAYKEQKKKASLLFDPKEAASIDKETFYEIGLSGFTELKNINSFFNEFENTLFSVSSKVFERAVQTEESNKKLNTALRSFLLKLSPYFLLLPSQKALEWLIQRFHIHLYNKNDIFTLILPYHETKIFIRFVQIMNLSDETEFWHWLEPIQKPGIPLAKIVLHNHCVSNVGFLKFISDMIKGTLDEFGDKAEILTTLFAFYCSTIVGTLESAPKITEAIVTNILPGIMECLSSPLIDLRAAGYMITAQLVLKVQLKAKTAKHLVHKIILFNPELNYEAVLLLHIIYESQSNIINISEKCLNNFTPNHLEMLCLNLELLIKSGINITKFMLAFMRGVLPLVQKDQEYFKRFYKLPEAVVADVNVESSIAEDLIKCVIDCYVPSVKKAAENDDESDIEVIEDDNKTKDLSPIQTWYSGFLKSLEQKYPSEFDQVLKQYRTNSQVSEEKLSSLSEILGFAPKIMKKLGDSYLFEKLYHHNIDVRVKAVDYLISEFKTLCIDNKKFLGESVLDRLNDESPDVVQPILSINVNILIDVIDKEVLIDNLQKIIIKGQLQLPWFKAACEAIKILLTFDIDLLNNEICFSIMPYLFPTNEDAKDIVLNILKSELGKYLLSNQNVSNITDKDDHKKICKDIFNLLKTGSNLKQTDLVDILDWVEEENYMSIFYSLILISFNIKNENLESNLKLLKEITQFIKRLNIVTVDETTVLSEDTIVTFIDATKENKFPIELYMYILQQQIENIVVSDRSQPWLDFSEKNSSNEFIVNLFETILNSRFRKYKKCYSSTMKALLDIICPNNKDKVEFMANLVIGFTSSKKETENYGESNAILIRTIRIMSAMFQNIKDLAWACESDIIITSIILCVHSKEFLVREVTFTIIKTILDKCAPSTKYYFLFLQELSARKEQLMIDHNQLPLVVWTILFQDKCKLRALQVPMKTTMNSLLKILLSKSTPYHVKRCLTTILVYINTPGVLNTLSPLAMDILEDSKNSIMDYHRSQTFANIIHRLSVKTYTPESDDLWKLIITSFDRLTMIDDEKNILYSCIFIMKQINQDLFGILSLERSQEILKAVISAGTYGNNAFIVTTASKLMKRIELSADQMLPLFNEMQKAYASDKNKTQKRSSTPTLSLLESKEWKLGVTLLEYIQDKKKLNGIDEILKVLFSTLKMCLSFDEQSAVEYIKQLLLSCILHCCQKVYPFENTKDKDTYKKAIDIEMIILCIRGTQNPQTHHHTLMLLPQIALMFPNEVLQHMMAIFTFIGSSVLRQDDAYSFQIITKIIETVIPILVKPDNVTILDDKPVPVLQSRVIPVLRIFVDAVLDIPEHRRFILYKKLIDTLNAEHFLWTFLGLMFESYIVHGANEKKAVDDLQRKLSDKEKPVGRLDFAISLTVDFAPNVIMETCSKLITFLKTMPEEKPDGEEVVKKVDPTVIFSVPHHTAKQLRHFKYTIVTFVNSLLSSEIFIANVNAFEDKPIMETLYKTFIVNILTFIQTVSRTADQNVGKPQAKYWKVMLHHCYEVLDNANNLLSSKMFVVVVRGLMSHNLLAVKRKSMEILNNKLQHHASFFTTCESNIMFSLLEPLLDIVKDIRVYSEEPQINKQETEVNQQTALLSLKLLIRLLCNDHPEEFKPILILVTDLIKSPAFSGNLMASVVLCLAELCSNLKTHAISSLPMFMPSLIKILKSQTKEDAPDLILLSVITAIYKVVDTVPRFLSPYLEKLLYQLAILSAKWEKKNKSSPIMAKLTMINNKISNKIAPRVLIPVISQCYNLLLKKGSFDAIGPAMNILAESFSGVTGPSFTALQQDLTSFFLLALQFRSDYVEESEISQEQIDVIEEHIIKALVALVLKLSESSFRPLYYKIYDWSNRSNDDKHKYRSITFYRLSSQIAESLRGLFILFAGHFIKNAADLLNACNKTKTEKLYFDDESDCCILIEYILKTFYSVFTYDSQNFVNKERFETIMQPLVDQLDNTVGGTESLTLRGKELIIPCIAQFSMATADDSLWKPLNYQILLKTRHADASIRLLGLESMREMATKLGDSWLPLLPESVPFLAELLEDDMPSVESATQKAIQTLESVLGEPLQKYF